MNEDWEKTPGGMRLDWNKLLKRGPEWIDPRRVKIKEVPLTELGIAAAYVVLGGAWVILSDEVLDRVAGASRDSTVVQTFKGVNFVITTGILLYLVLRRSF